MCLFHPSHPRGGHPPHSNLVRGKLTPPTPALEETGPTVLRPIREDETSFSAEGQKQVAHVGRPRVLCLA